MSDTNQNATITAEPVWVPEELIVVPMKAVPEKPAVPYVPYAEVSGIKGIILNIETSGIDPLANRIIAIGIQDPLFPEDNPSVIMLDDEASMILALFTIIQEGGYNQIIGYNLGFDFRFVFLKAMFYGIDCKEFYDCTLFDLMEGCAQVKMTFVYNAQKALDLSDLADWLWKYPKPFTDAEMIKKWASGDSEAVLEFASGQVTRTLALYLLYRKTSENMFVLPASGIVEGGGAFSSTPTAQSSSFLTIPEAHSEGTWLAKCPTCLAEWNVTVHAPDFICPIDGTRIVRK